MSKIVIDTKGIDLILARMPGKSAELLDRGAAAVQGRAMFHAPVDTGALANSLHVENKSQFIRWVADGVHYGIYQEFGTYKMAAHPFMNPAVEEIRPDFARSWRELFELL